VETERKWVLTSLPADLPAGVAIRQAYLTTSPGEVRIREIGTEYRLTVKSDGSISREEAEAPIPKWAFDILWPQCTARILKRRHSIPYANRVVEVDVFDPPLAGLLMAEVEFPTVELARAFEPPSWLGTLREVTEDSRYKNKSLAVHGLPPDHQES
jgi:adenylate cyclase